MMKRLASLLLLSFLAFALAAGETFTPKRGGVCFRFDDNQPEPVLAALMELFERHHAPMNLAVIFGREIAPAYAERLRQMQAAGHEIMDHTPEHRIFKLRIPGAAEQPWTDHVIDGTARLRYRCQPDDPDAPVFTTVVEGDRITVPKPLQPTLRRFLYIRNTADQKLYMVRPDAEGVWRLADFWGDPVSFPPGLHTATFRGVDRWRAFSVDPEALVFMAGFVRARCRELGLKPPVTWIQPGTSEPVLDGENVRQALEPLGYRSAATYTDRARKTFGEPHPERCAFRMEWGDVQLERNLPPAAYKSQIADGVAKHHVLIAGSHCRTQNFPDKLAGFLRLYDEILAWCRASGIELRTQSDWADRLYRDRHDPAENIFPPWTTDLDGDGKPDGYDPLPEGANVTDGRLTIPAGRFLSITRLGGLEYGWNTLTFRVGSGTPHVTLTFCRLGEPIGEPLALIGDTLRFTFPPEASELTLTIGGGTEPLTLLSAHLSQ